MKLLTKSMLILFAFLFLFGCAAKQMDTLPSFEAKQFDASMYKSKVDNFLILFDASSSMYFKYNQMKKFDIARAVVDRMNQTIPEMGQAAGLRSFGHDARVSKNNTELFYGMTSYSTQELADKFAKVKYPGGFSPLYLALDKAKTDLVGLYGKRHAVIIVSDGLDLPGDVLASAKALKAQYADTLCYYPILVGNDPKGEQLLKEIAAIGGCGFYSTADEVLTSAGMAAFVEKVFLERKAAAPAAPAVVKVERKDTDGDGVYDDEDQCPGTPMGASVNAVGCWVLDNVLFDFDKDVIKAEAYPLLDNVAKILEKNPIMSVELHGHCDNVGTEAYNMDLSMRRAHAVKNYLIGKGILKNRMATEGFGYTKPVALNGTDTGRAMNRRVEIHPY